MAVGKRMDCAAKDKATLFEKEGTMRTPTADMILNNKLTKGKYV
jgi:hypothetical protein